MEPTNDKQRKAKRTTTDATPDARDAPAGVRTHDPQPGTAAAGTSQELHDEAIKEAVEDIHG